MKRRNWMRMLSLFLAIFMLFCVTGCGDKVTTSEIVTWEDVEDEDANGQGTEGSTTKETAKETESGTKKSKKTNSNVKIDWLDVGKIGANGKDYSNFNPYKGIEKYKGVTLQYATWEDISAQPYASAVADFEKKYGIKLDGVYCTQANYVQEVLALIAAGKSPDIIIENGFFPSSVQVVQPFSVSGQDTNEPFWDQKEMSAMSVNGKIYFVNAVNSVAKIYGTCCYNKDLLESNGIKTPGDYYKEGNWTFENLRKVMQQVASLGSDYSGAYIDSSFLLCANDAQLVKYDGKKFINNITSNKAVEVLKFITQVQNENLTCTSDVFINGKAAVALSHNSCLKKNSSYAAMDVDGLDFTYMPVLKKGDTLFSSGFLRGYGISKGAKNPQAAGMLIRYMLDPNNCDLMGDAFVNENAAKFYCESVKMNAKSTRAVDYSQGVGNSAGSWWGYWVRGIDTPEQVATVLQSNYNVVQNCVDSANKILAGIK